MAGIGVERHAGHRHVDPQNFLGVAPDRRRKPLPAGLRNERQRQQLLAHLDLDSADAAPAAAAMRARKSASTLPASSSGIMRRSIRNTTWSGTTLVLMPPLISPTLSVGDTMPGTRERVARKLGAMRIERGQDRGRRLQRVRAGFRHRGMRLLAGDGDLEMQAAIVGVDDRIGKARGDHRVGPVRPCSSSHLGPTSPPTSSS